MIELEPLWSEVERAIHAWVHSTTGVNAVWANHDGPEPKYPLIVLDVIAGPTPIALHKEKRIVGDVGCEEVLVTTPVEFTLNVQAHAGGPDSKSPDGLAMRYLESAEWGLSLEEHAAPLCRLGLIVYNIEGMLDISEVVGSGRVSRATQDFMFRYRAKHRAPLSAEGGIIDKVQITTAFDNAPENITLAED